MDCKFRAKLVEVSISQTLAAAPEQHTLHNYSPTATLAEHALLSQRFTGGVKHHFPLSLVPGKPQFYVGKFGQHMKVTL